MKKLFLLLYFIISASFVFSQAQLKGIVKLQSSGSKPLAGVKISAFGAGSDFSDENGMFELKFANKKAGMAIDLVIYKEGFELVNEKEIEACILPIDINKAITIILSKQGEKDKQALSYYNIIVENANQSFKDEFDRIQSQLKKLDEDDTERNTLYIQIDELQKEKERLIAKAEDLAKQLAAVDLDAVSGLAKKAYEHFKKGEIKKAIEILSDQKLSDNLKSAQEQKQKADSIWRQSIENYMIKARFCIADRRYETAYICYLKAIEADSKGVDNLWELADFCDSTLNDQISAIKYYRIALRHVNSESIKATLLNNLGKQYVIQNSYPIAENVLEKALSIRRRLAKTNPDRFDPDIADTQNILGLMYAHLNNFHLAQKAYKEALSIRKRLAKTNPDRYNSDFAITQHNLGALYYELKNYPSAETAYKMALSIFIDLAKVKPDYYYPYIAITQTTLGNLYFKLNNYLLAEKSYKAALSISEPLAITNPARYDPTVGDIQNNLGFMYCQLNNYPFAEKALKKALLIRRRLAKTNPDRYNPDLAMTQNNLGILFLNYKNYLLAEKAFKKALLIRKRLAKINPDKYDSEVADTQNNLGVLYGKLQNYPLAEKSYKAALLIRKRLAKINPDKYDPDVAGIQNNLGFMYYNLKNYPSAEEAYIEALSIKKRLAKKNPASYSPDLALTQNNLGNLYCDLKNYPSAEKAYIEALSIYKHLAKTTPSRYDPDVAMLQNNLGVFYKKLGKYKEAETSYHIALSITERLVKENPKRNKMSLCQTLWNIALLKKAQLENTLDIKYRDEGLILIEKAQKILATCDSDMPIVKAYNKDTESLTADLKAITAQGLLIQAQINKVIPLVEKNEKLKDPAKRVANQEKVIESLVALQIQHPTSKLLKNRIADAMGNLAWYYLLTQQFDLAEQAARNGMKADSSEEWINTNLALSLLYQGKYEEARRLYLELKDKPYRGGTYKEVFLEDLAALEKAGIEHSDTPKIKALLEE